MKNLRKPFQSLLFMSDALLFLAGKAKAQEDICWRNNEAMRQFCPGGCCPVSCNLEESRPNKALDYCLNHPEARKMTSWLKKQEEGEESTSMTLPRRD